MSHSTSENQQAPVIRWLAATESHNGAAVERVETHAAYVFLAGNRAYKLKRAIKLPFLDFSTTDKRRAALEREITLNRRTTDNLYLGIQAIVTREDGKLAMVGPPESDTAVLDWVLVMRRFPQSSVLDAMAVAGTLTDDIAPSLAIAIADLHATAHIDHSRDAAASMRAVVDENDSELRNWPDLFDPQVVAAIHAASSAMLDGPIGDRLGARADAGWVRRGHGDLHLRNICMIDNLPTLFDALEFDEALATTDVIYDLCFLLMDLENRRLYRFANLVLNRYLEATQDYTGLALIPLFLSVRAAIRAKIDAIDLHQHWENLSGGDRDRRHASAAGYLSLARRVLDPTAPRLVAVGGYSGSGKSTVARNIASAFPEHCGAVVLRSDAIRKAMLGRSFEDRLEPKHYDEQTSIATYTRMYEFAKEVLQQGRSVILDATFAAPESRRLAEDVAAARDVPFSGLWIEVDPDVLVRRVAERAGDVSDATVPVLRGQLQADVGTMTWQRIPGDDDPETVLETTTAALGLPLPSGR